MQKIIIAICITVLFSCTSLPESIGKDNEIIIISSPEDKPFIINLMVDLFSHAINTPQLELEFSLHYRNPWEIENVKKHGNIIIASLDFPQDSSGDYLMQRILETNQKEESLFVLSDLYAKNQIICGIHTLDAISMENHININKEWILNEFRNILETRMKLNIFKYGKNVRLSKQVSQIFGYTIDLQPDFKIIKSDSQKQFIWIGRGYPYRWITIHKSEKSNYDQINESWNQLHIEFAELMPHIMIGDYIRSVETQQNDDESRHIMRGVYEHDESDSGGPFFVYIFDTDSVNEVILVSGFVNHPGHEKILLLKQLEIIANTLHKGDN